MTELYFFLAAGLTGYTWGIKRDTLSGVLFAALVVSFASAISFDGWRLLAYAGAIDAFVCLVMLALWTRHHSMRAWTVGLIGMVKTGLTLGQYAIGPHAIGWGYAVALNAAFLAQVIAAGGYADGMGLRLDNLFRRVSPRRHGLLRDGEN